MCCCVIIDMDFQSIQSLPILKWSIFKNMITFSYILYTKTFFFFFLETFPSNDDDDDDDDDACCCPSCCRFVFFQFYYYIFSNF